MFTGCTIPILKKAVRFNTRLSLLKYLFCSCRNYFLLNICRSFLISFKIKCIASSALCHRTKVNAVFSYLRKRHFGNNAFLSAVNRIHAQYSSTAFINVTHYITHIFFRYSNLNMGYRLKYCRFRLCNSIFKSK